MSAPSGYTALDFVGFTDKGTYSPIVKYMRNDLVHHGGNIMRCKVDDTMNVTPVEGANWELWIGASANLAERTIAPLENNPADMAFGVGRQIIYDDWLWEVIAPIEVGDALIDYAVDPTNANIKKSVPVETQLLAVKAEADATDNMIAPTEVSASSSSAAYSVGDQLILNNILYDVIAAIQIGDALTTGTGGNIATADTLTDQLNAKANSSDLAAVATSGSYNDLSNKPTLGTAAAKNSTSAVTSGSTDLVESGAVYTEIQTLSNQTAKKTDLTNVIITGTTNNTGSIISANRYFYLNGVLAKAKVDIPDGATFTLDTNYEVANPLFDLGTIIKNSSAVFTQGWTSASIQTGIETEITSRQLDPNGVYLISFFNSYGNSFTQNAYLMIRWGNDNARERVMNVGTGYVGGALSAFAIVTGSSLVHFKVRQDSDSAQTGTGSLKIVRLY